jgi:hypothetical protein
MAEQAEGAALVFDPLSVDSLAKTLECLWNDDNLCADLRQRGMVHAARWGQSEFGQVLTSIVRDTIPLVTKS